VYLAYMCGWVCVILGVAGVSGGGGVCGSFSVAVKACVGDPLNRRPVCWFLVVSVLITVVLDNCAALTQSCVAYGDHYLTVCCHCTNLSLYLVLSCLHAKNILCYVVAVLC